MGYISKPGRRSIFSDEHRISSILRDELKMPPSTLRELLLTMDNILNDRLQEIIQYGDTIRENNDRLERRIDQMDRILFWIVCLGIPGLVVLFAVVARQ